MHSNQSTFLLTSEQQAASDGLFNLIQNKPINGALACVLTGSAGTGKTTTILALIEQLRKSRVQYNLTATTNAAADVIQLITGDEAATIHKLLLLKPSIDNRGKEIFKVGYAKNYAPYGSVVIVDEASMVDFKLLKAIADAAKKNYLSVVFIGDPYQLPPTKGKCTIFDSTLPTFQLNTVHRQNGNPILDKAIEFRDFISGASNNFPTIITDLDSNGEGIEVLSPSDFQDKFMQTYATYNTGEKITTPLCAYTNEKCIEYNNLIRKTKYLVTHGIAPYYLGELLLSNSTVLHDRDVIIKNNEECIVNNYTSSVFKLGAFSIDTHLVDVTKVIGGSQHRIHCPVSIADKKAFDNNIKKAIIAGTTSIKWYEYYNAMSQLADLRSPFAGTTHKAQGSTYEEVFIDADDIYTCRSPAMQARLMYVALTRARKKVYICQTK